MKYSNNIFDSEEFRMQFRELEDPEDLSMPGIVKEIVRLETLRYHINNSLQARLVEQMETSTVDQEKISELLEKRLDDLYEEITRREERYKGF